MAVTIDHAKALIIEFCAVYPVASEIKFRVRDTQEELYGKEFSKEAVGTVYGGFHPRQRQADFAAANFRDADEFKDTIRHEILGHFGINTFTSGEKRAVLNAILDARDTPGIADLWQHVDRNYSDASELVKAEEVYAFACEAVMPEQQSHTLAGEQVLREVCLDRSRPMQIRDLITLTTMVAGGLRERTRTQQNFPATDFDQFKRDTSMDTPRKPFHEAVAEKLIEQLKAGTAPWQRPWQPGEPGAMLPINPTTGKRYKGINALQLMSEGHSDQRWMTYKQAAAVDAQVRKGEKGTPIQYWKFSEEHDKLDASGKPVLDAKGEPIKQTVKLERPRVFFATVFNAEQIDGLPALQPRKQQDWNAVERAEQILQASGAVIRHGEQNRAFYRPATDSIHLPDKGQFSTADNYYATALHELGHWTGHESRLDRDLVHPFGSEGYAKEELRAEIASMILGDELGIGHDPGQHAAYVGLWIKALQEEPLEIFRAAADAEKIQAYVLGLEQQQVQEQAAQQTDEPGDVTTPETAMKLPRKQVAQGKEAAIAVSSERIFIDVPFKQKDEGKSKGYALDPEQKAQLQAKAAATLQARETEQALLQEQAARRVVREMADLVPVTQPTPYMQAKGIQPHVGVLTDNEGLKTYVPAIDANGKQWTTNYIQAEGTKRFAKHSRKEGCFHVVGGLEALSTAPALIIAEGYSTAATLAQSLGYAAVAAFDAGNLPHVAKALHAKFPDKPIIIAGDNATHLQATLGVNPSRAKAEEAAMSVGGKTLFPIFAPQEQAANAEGNKSFKDFNDLATKSTLGKEGVDRQVRSIVNSEIEKHQARIEQQRKLALVQRQEQRPRRTAKIG